MKLATSAFELGYTPSFEVFDQSPLYLDAVLGTPAFSRLVLPRLAGRLNSDQMHEIGGMTEFFGRVEACVAQPVAGDACRVGGVEYVLSWERVEQRAGIFSIQGADRIASVSLMICRDRDSDVDEHPGLDMALLAFMRALHRVMPEEPDAYDHRKFNLITMTRRPLVASVFWPPYSPTGDSAVRTIQLQMAYAFFHLNGEL